MTIPTRSLPAFFEPIEDRWNHCEGLPEEGLLRLALLRELTRALHAEKSRVLAHGAKGEALELRAWEDKIHEVREATRLDGKLSELLTTQRPPGKRTRLLPAALHTSIPRDRFERYDRQWEALLAAEGASQGWSFWALDAWVQIDQAETCDAALRDRLWPRAVVLFSESADERGAGIEGSEWHGRWLVLLHAQLRTPQELNTDFGQLPGLRAGSAAWRLLFSARSR